MTTTATRSGPKCSDLDQGSQFYPAANVIGSDDVAVTGNSDIVVITAGAKQKPGSRGWSSRA
jgi:L-lactate dehydrogenase